MEQSGDFQISYCKTRTSDGISTSGKRQLVQHMKVCGEVPSTMVLINAGITMQKQTLEVIA
jgi:hypothetical protein